MRDPLRPLICDSALEHKRFLSKAASMSLKSSIGMFPLTLLRPLGGLCHAKRH